jgi:hypothetical protein
MEYERHHQRRIDAGHAWGADRFAVTKVAKSLDVSATTVRTALEAREKADREAQDVIERHMGVNPNSDAAKNFAKTFVANTDRDALEAESAGYNPGPTPRRVPGNSIALSDTATTAAAITDLLKVAVKEKTAVEQSGNDDSL